MSGIEALGIVLGALPLIISAFEHLREACEARDLLVHFERKHMKALNDVKDERLLFRLHLRKLLLPLVKDGVLEEHDIEQLMLDKELSRWRQHDLELALKQRLGEAHERYLEILKDVQNTLHRLLCTLGFALSPFQEKLDALQVGMRDNTETYESYVLN